MIKIAIIIFAILSIILIYRRLNTEYFLQKTKRNLSEYKSKELVDIFNKFDINNIHYNYIYNWGLINNLAHVIKDKMDPELEKVINKKIIDVYVLIKQNNEKSNNLKNYLKFMNLVGESGLPIFIEINRTIDMSKTNLISKEIMLLNEIKILLVLMPNWNKIFFLNN